MQPAGSAPMTPAAVLVVEDDPALRQAIVGTTERAGYAVTAVTDGLAAAEAIGSRHVDVVLLDIGLPFVDGWRILASLEGQRTPSVIVNSARGEERDQGAPSTWAPTTTSPSPSAPTSCWRACAPCCAGCGPPRSRPGW